MTRIERVLAVYDMVTFIRPLARFRNGTGTTPALTQKRESRTWTPESGKHVQTVFFQFYEATNQKDAKRAITLGEELCRLDDSPQDRFNLACLYVEESRFDDAIKKLNEAIACAPNDPSFRVAE